MKLRLALIGQDHPRLRGEHELTKISERIGAGSPPPTRGTRATYNQAEIINRITPAYAGNTNILRSICQCLQDHPRLRGEHAFLALRPSFIMGSPPPTRGTLICRMVVVFGIRITPAYAGNTLNVS